jgi:hypothetical protein
MTVDQAWSLTVLAIAAVVAGMILRQIVAT